MSSERKGSQTQLNGVSPQIDNPSRTMIPINRKLGRSFWRDVRHEKAFLQIKHPEKSQAEHVAELEDAYRRLQADPSYVGGYYESRVRAIKKSNRRLTTIRRLSHDPAYPQQVEGYINMSQFPTLPRVKKHAEVLGGNIHPAIARVICDALGVAFQKMRQEGQGVLDNKITNQVIFEEKLRAYWPDALMEVFPEISENGAVNQSGLKAEFNNAFEYWFRHRDEIQKASESKFDKTKQIFLARKKKVVTGAALKIMTVGAYIQDKTGKPDDLVHRREQRNAKERTRLRRIAGIPGRVKERFGEESSMLAEGMMRTPLMMQMQKEIKNHVRARKKDGEILSPEQVQTLIEQFSIYYGMPADKLTKNPDFANKLLHAGITSFISTRIADLVGVAAYAGILTGPGQEVVKVFGPLGLSIAAGMAIASVVARGMSDIKALKKNGYSSSALETSYFSILENATSDKELNAKRATILALALKSGWFMSAPWYAPFAYGDMPKSLIAWLGSYPADQIVYASANKVGPALKKTYSRVKEKTRSLRSKSQDPQKPDVAIMFNTSDRNLDVEADVVEIAVFETTTRQI